MMFKQKRRGISAAQSFCFVVMQGDSVPRMGSRAAKVEMGPWVRFSTSLRPASLEVCPVLRDVCAFRADQNEAHSDDR